jgi:flagellar biosynthesis/type III secretory pathway protein FliH
MLSAEFNLADAQKVWLEEGMEKGIEKGMEKGMAKGRAEVARRLKKMGIMPNDEISRISGLIKTL